MEITAINVNQLFTEGLWRMRTSGVETETRNGPALYIPEPVMTTILEPTERVLFYGRRDCNPIFHLMESIWMLAGRNDVEFLKNFNSKIDQYSDDGVIFNAPYGYRMRSQFGIDQLEHIIHHLKADPKSRQAVIQLWDPADLNKSTKDRACNTQLMFSIRSGELDMLVVNRSNDFWWGYCGANPVHFSIIQEFIAIALNLKVGLYHSISNNLHLYTNLYNAMPDFECPPDDGLFDYYSSNKVRPRRLFEGEWRSFLVECRRFCNNPFEETNYSHEFFLHTARPMARVALARREKSSSGIAEARSIKSSDWRRATIEYIIRRERANASK